MLRLRRTQRPRRFDFRGVTRFLKLDEELANRRYITGDKFTIADITAMIAVDFGRVSKVAIKPEQRNLARWHAEVAPAPPQKHDRDDLWSAGHPGWC